MVKWGSRVEIEIKRRIKISIWAYAYEFEDDSIVDDFHFDRECYLVDLSISTGNKKLDDYFKKEFDPCTGVWIQRHLELDKIKKLYNKYYKL